MRFLKWVFRILIVLALIVALVVSAAVMWFWHSMPDTEDMCGNDIVSELPSPDGLRKVVVFERDCGATTGFSTQVSVLLANATLSNKEGNLFIADTDHDAAPSGPGGGPGVRVVWENAQSIVLAHHAKARVFRAETEVEGVREICHCSLSGVGCAEHREPPARGT